MARARLEAAPVILGDRNTVLKRRRSAVVKHIYKIFQRIQIKPDLHFIVAEGLQHFQADLLRFCWQQQGQVSCFDSSWKLAQLSCAAFSSRTQSGVQKQSPNSLRIAVLLVLEDLTGDYLLLHLQ